MDDVEAYLQLRRDMILNAVDYAVSFPILEIGCGSGFVVEKIGPVFEGQIVVAIDRNRFRLSALVQKGLKNVAAIAADAASMPFAEFGIGTILIINTLHELIPRLDTDLSAFFKDLHSILRPGGRIIVQDIRMPEDCQVSITITDKRLIERLCEFRSSRRMGEIAVAQTGATVMMSIKDAAEFAAKSKVSSRDEWLAELAESHLNLSETVINIAGEAAGFAIVRNHIYEDIRTIQLQRPGIETKAIYYESWFEVVLQKNK